MKKSKVTYKPFSSLYFYKYMLAFCFLFLLIVNPIVSNSAVLENNKYELIDHSEKENSKKSETVLEGEIENSFLYNNAISLELNEKLIQSYFIIQQSILNFNLDIQLPPPRVQFLHQKLFYLAFLINGDRI